VDFTYRIQRPKLPDECLILNHVALASILSANASERDILVKGLPEWILFYAVAGYEYFPQERVEYCVHDIAEIAKACNVNPVEFCNGVPARKLLGLLSRPSDEPYWKIRHQGGCQDVFFLNTLDRAHEFVAEVKAACAQHAFSSGDCGVYVQPIQQGRNVHIEFNLMYNPQDTAARERVKSMYESVSASVSARGGFFSRPYGIWSDLAYPKCPDTVVALGKVKSILDPNGIMNPGKLCFGKGVAL
jgi:FAD/FMN-containing dehydrogenase